MSVESIVRDLSIWLAPAVHVITRCGTGALQTVLESAPAVLRPLLAQIGEALAEAARDDPEFQGELARLESLPTAARSEPLARTIERLLANREELRNALQATLAHQGTSYNRSAHIEGDNTQIASISFGDTHHH